MPGRSEWGRSGSRPANIFPRTCSRARPWAAGSAGSCRRFIRLGPSSRGWTEGEMKGLVDEMLDGWVEDAPQEDEEDGAAGHRSLKIRDAVALRFLQRKPGDKPQGVQRCLDTPS